MRKGKYTNGKHLNVKPLAALLAVALLIGGAVGGTLAWLTDETEAVVNTFTVGNINIDLTETTDDFKMVPGCTIDKDPVVTVKAESEDCWVFVKVEASKNLNDFIAYEVDANNWTQLDVEGLSPTEKVYYCYAKDITADRNIKVLLNNQVTVKTTVTKEMMDALEGENKPLPQLNFTAYAIQMAGFDTPKAAWENLQKQISATP